VGNGEGTETKHVGFPASRTTRQGEVWLSWENAVREWFVEAALAGYKTGYDEGFKDGMTTIKGSQTVDPQKSEDEVCPNGNRFRNEAPRYSKEMSDFYARYPEDRDIPLAYLIRMLVGTRPKTLKEIHEWATSIGQ
jgi:hypothetical protein